MKNASQGNIEETTLDQRTTVNRGTRGLREEKRDLITDSIQIIKSMNPEKQASLEIEVKSSLEKQGMETKENMENKMISDPEKHDILVNLRNTKDPKEFQVINLARLTNLTY